jgi:integrase
MAPQLSGVLERTAKGRKNDFKLLFLIDFMWLFASAAAILNLFAQWYRLTGLKGCSSHSGRRTFITNAARTISTVGGSLRDVQMLAGHRALSTTQRYIEADVEAQKRVVDLV